MAVGAGRVGVKVAVGRTGVFVGVRGAVVPVGGGTVAGDVGGVPPPARVAVGTTAVPPAPGLEVGAAVAGGRVAVAVEPPAVGEGRVVGG